MEVILRMLLEPPSSLRMSGVLGRPLLFIINFLDGII